MSSEEKEPYKITFADETFILDGSGSLYWPEQNMLIFSDAHFEKGSYLAHRGNPLPLYDTHDTLNRIEQLIKIYQPAQVISLGDNMHDAKALQRMTNADLQYLQKICTTIPKWVWIIGNHDKADYAESVLKDMSFEIKLEIKGITFTHDLLADVPHQAIGHYHPKITVPLKQGKVTDKCFVLTSNKLLLPSFGKYTGGLDVSHQVLQNVIDDDNARYFICHKQKIWRVK